MRLRIRSTLMFAIVALMACSLSAVSAVVLLRHLAVVQTVADREIEQAANDVAHRVSRFLENGPAVLNRVKYFIEHQGIALTDTGRMTDYLVSEAQASPALTWVSVSSAETGAFLGVTRRDGALVLNRSDPTVNGGIAREWELRADGTWASLKTGPGVPYDPRDRAWFVQGIDTNRPSWTDPYQFAEGAGRHLGGDRPEASRHGSGHGRRDRRLPPARDRNFPERVARRAVRGAP